MNPKGVYLVVESHKYTKSDAELMTKIINHYKATSELLKLGNLKPESKVKKEKIVKP